MSDLIPIDEVVHFDVTTSHPTTGAATDADSVPTFEVYEEATDTGMLDTGSPSSPTQMVKRGALTGNYRGTFTVSAANGFEQGKWYNVIATATVNSVTGKCVVMTFRVAAVEGYPGIPVVDAHALDWNTTESPGNLIVRTPDGATIIYTKTLTSDAAAEPATGVS